MINPENLNYQKSFFNDEVREGFYISSMMKSYWAGQIKVLSEIAKICDRHSISWFADYGTLIGAVRHGGYIPWDDDLDICMLREDYDRFMTYADMELPDNYYILSLENESEFNLMLGRVVNGKSIDYSKNRLEEFYGCPYTIGVDIFPLDGLAQDEEKEQERLEKCKELVEAIEIVNNCKQDTIEGRKKLADIERNNHTVLHRKGNLEHELLILTEKQYKKFSYDSFNEVALMPFWVKGKDHKFPRAFFEQNTVLNFENTFLSVSAFYEEMLKIEYGDYMKVYRAGGIHDYPVYRDQEAILKNHIGYNPFRYTFPDNVIDNKFKENLNKATQNKINFTNYCSEISEIMITTVHQMKNLFTAEEYGAVYKLLEGCQFIAVSLGNEVEKRVKECNVVIMLLEKYCEMVYICHEKLADGVLKKDEICEIEDLVTSICENIDTIIKNRKRQVLFLPCSPRWWDSMEGIYTEKIMSKENECIVIPIPCYQKDIISGEIVGVVEDLCNYPDEIWQNNKLWENIDFEKKYFDEIIIQFPFDGWNRSMDIPEIFYSENLVNHTDILIYTPCYVPVFPEQDDAKLYEAMKVLVEQPAVMFSDKVILHSQKEMETYLSIADELTWKKFTEGWKEKFCVSDNQYTMKTHDANTEDVYERRKALVEKCGLPIEYVDKKVLLYHIGISSILKCGDQIIDRLKETITIITNNEDRLRCIFSPSENVFELERINYELWAKYCMFIDGLSDDASIFIDEGCNALSFVDIADGYYGDGDVVAHHCRNKGIPVMIRKVF